MMTEDHIKNLEFCNKILITEIEKIKANSVRLKDHITPDVFIPIVYLETFSACFSEKKFDNLEEAWKFVNDIRGVIEKISYVNINFKRINESIEAKNEK